MMSQWSFTNFHDRRASQTYLFWKYRYIVFLIKSWTLSIHKKIHVHQPIKTQECPPPTTHIHTLVDLELFHWASVSPQQTSKTIPETISEPWRDLAVQGPFWAHLWLLSPLTVRKPGFSAVLSSTDKRHLPQSSEQNSDGTSIRQLQPASIARCLPWVA